MCDMAERSWLWIESPPQLLHVDCEGDVSSPGPVKDGAEMGDSEFVGA